MSSFFRSWDIFDRRRWQTFFQGSIFNFSNLIFWFRAECSCIQKLVSSWIKAIPFQSTLFCCLVIWWYPYNGLILFWSKQFQFNQFNSIILLIECPPIRGLILFLWKQFNFWCTNSILENEKLLISLKLILFFVNQC